jgi:hypothetical protein
MTLIKSTCSLYFQLIFKFSKFTTLDVVLLRINLCESYAQDEFFRL